MKPSASSLPPESVAPSAARCLGAPAKLNLGLRVLGRRDDGYHRIVSLIGFVSLADRLALAPDRALSLEIDGPFADGLSAGEDNLILRAARRLAAWAGREGLGARISLHKVIPLAAGLGGGSADAAATLVGLADLWGLNDAPLSRLALELGADVPVCLASETALAEGIGECLTPCPPLPEAGLLLVNPGVRLETGPVFKAWSAHHGGAPCDPASRAPAQVLPALLPVADAAALAASLAEHPNDLTDAAIRIQPVIAEVLKALDDSAGCLLSRMSGSGATCFGLYRDRDHARKARQILAERAPEWWCRTAGFVHGRLAVLPGG